MSVVRLAPRPAGAGPRAGMEAARWAVEAARWGAGLWLLWRVPRPRPVPDDGPAAADRAAWVVVPARDEEASIGALLASLASQSPAPAAVVVVDDASTDATAALARAAGAQVVTAGQVPDGWTGKAWAAALGARQAGGEVLVFLDADTVVEPGGLGRLVAELASQGGRGLVSAQPFHHIERPYEALSAFFNLVAPMGTGAFTPRAGRGRPVGAFGPCLVCSRADYQAVGGHASVRGAVLDDAALARRFEQAGLPVRLLGGRGAVRYRMYPSGVAQLAEGWTKNMASGAGMVRPATMVAVVAWLSGAISAVWYALAGLRRLRRAPPGARAAGLVPVTGPYLAYAAQLGWMLRRVGRFGVLTSLAYPLPLAFFLGVFTRSVVVTAVRGEVRWKGRTLPTRPPVR